MANIVWYRENMKKKTAQSYSYAQNEQKKNNNKLVHMIFI